jgi:very-short-patch-repair endonuclease
VEIETHLGTFWADLGWPEWRVVIEYDGRAKYTAGGSAANALMSEKRRHDAIVEAGWRVLRLTGEDLRQPDLTIRRVLRALPPGVVERLSPRRALCQ